MSKHTQIIMCQRKYAIVVAKDEIVHRIFKKTFCVELVFFNCFGCIMQEKTKAIKNFLYKQLSLFNIRNYVVKNNSSFLI